MLTSMERTSARERDDGASASSSKQSSIASWRLVSASSTLSPWLATSTSTPRAT